MMKLNLPGSLRPPVQNLGDRERNADRSASDGKPKPREKNKRNRKYSGKYQPDDFPPELRVPLLAALESHDGAEALELLTSGAGAYLPTAWNLRFKLVTDRYIVKAYQKPSQALARKITSGEITTLAELKAQVAGIVGNNSRKYCSKSHKVDNPKVGYGQRRDSTRPHAAARGLIVTGLPYSVELKEATGTRPDQFVQADELDKIILIARATVAPLDLRIFDTVQAYRTAQGISGAYPFAAQFLVTDPNGLPVAMSDWLDFDEEPLDTPTDLITYVRRTFLKVRSDLERHVTAAGYVVPVYRKRPAKSRKR